jgi:hypothetical protein
MAHWATSQTMNGQPDETIRERLVVAGAIFVVMALVAILLLEFCAPAWGGR